MSDPESVDTLLVLTTVAPGDHTLWAMRSANGTEVCCLVATVHPGAPVTYPKASWGRTGGTATTLDDSAVRVMHSAGTDVRRVPIAADATTRAMAKVASFLGMGLWA